MILETFKMCNQIIVEGCLTIPSSRALLSRDKRLPLDTWNQSGLQENVFGNKISTFHSPRDYSHRIQSDDAQRNREAVPEAERMKTSEDRQNQGTITMPTFATRPSTMSSATRPSTMSSTIPLKLPQNYMVGQQGQRIFEWQFDKFPNP